MRAACSGRCSGRGLQLLEGLERLPRQRAASRSPSVADHVEERHLEALRHQRGPPPARPWCPPPSTTTFLMSVFTALLGRRRACTAGGGALVHPVDEVLVLLLHHPALHLERRRQLARLQRELARQQGDLLDLLELGQVGGQVVDDLLVEGHHLGLRDQLLAAARRRRPSRAPTSRGSRSSGPPARPGSCACCRSSRSRRRAGCVLSRFSMGWGAMFLPPEVTMMSFLRSVMVRKPSRVEHADVAGVEPAVRVDRLGGGLRLLEVALHHVGPAGQDLAVGGDLHLDALDGQAHACRA